MKIAVPLDLSETAEKAIPHAAEIARGLGDELLLVTVSGLRLRQVLRDTSESEGAPVPELVQQYLESTATELNDLKVSCRVIKGDNAAEALVDFADKEDDLRMIVMATHGRTGMEKWMLGNVTEKVVRHANAPVLVVPTRPRG